jgi:signal transduction histidine kinase
LTTTLLPWRAAALEKGINWGTDIPDNLPEITIDSERMAQVLGNLLSNAVKYTPEGGSVLVSAGANKSEVWFRVSDTGPGIELEEQGQVFEPFYRSQKMRRFPQGLGLGLTIARDIVEAHGGKLELTSDPEQGSQFTVRLPLNSSLTG